ncbi:MAG: hypothetical protein NVSMB9_32730 [Isosphaeraceae bacterium]
MGKLSELRFFEISSILGWLFSLFMSAIIIPFISRLYRLHREQQHMIRKKLFEHSGVVIFGLFDGKLQSDYLGGFLTTFFGERLFDLIVGWNDGPSPSLIVPRNDFEADHMTEIMAAKASPYLLQSRRIDGYFRGAEVYGTPSYRFAKLIVGLARPDATKLSSHDYPRLIIVERGTLQRIMKEEVQPQWETQDSFTWLATVRELGERYFGGKHHGIAVLELPLDDGIVAPAGVSTPRSSPETFPNPTKPG